MRRMYRSIAAGLLAGVISMAGLTGQDRQTPDRLAAEIAAWQATAREEHPDLPLWGQVRPGAQAALAMAETARAGGHRWFALERLAAARNLLSAAGYIGTRDAETRKSVTAFEAEWQRVGRDLGAALVAPRPDAFNAIRPAASRALAETAAFQTKVLYDASVIYGRATDADSGLYYLGSALAQRELVALTRALPPVAAGRSSARSVSAETAALERRLLALYQPPVSIERHPEFIAASSALKEARELDAAGLHYGATFKYLQALQRTALLSQPAGRPAGDLSRELGQVQASLASDGQDHTILQVFLERAAVELAKPPAEQLALPTVAVILDDLVPAYRATRVAAPAPTPPVTAEVTVRLVRWPFT
ncbi:MAG: hypothetical protein AMXMBFR57_26100 [Acidimicrobiia bacterium]